MTVSTFVDVRPMHARAGGAYGVDPNESSLQLRSLLQKGVFNRLQRVLHDAPSRRIPLLVRCRSRPPACALRTVLVSRRAFSFQCWIADPLPPY